MIGAIGSRFNFVQTIFAATNSGARALRRTRGGLATLPYWAAVAVVSLANVALLSIGCGCAGLSFEAFLEGRREVAFLNMIALTVLLWPGVAVAVSGLTRGERFGWWGVALYPLAVLTFMAAFFGKPFSLDVLAGFSRLLPTVLFLLMAAWLIVEIGTRPTSRRTAAHTS